MTTVSSFPTKDGDFNLYVLAVLIYITIMANKTRLHISDANLATFTARVGLWAIVWPKSQDINQRTPAVTLDKNSLIKLMKGDLKVIYGDMPASALIQADRSLFRIFEPIPGAPIPVANYAVGIKLSKISHLRASILFSNSATPSSKAMPKGNFVFMEYYIGLAGIADADIPFANGTVVSTATYDIIFTDGDVGKTCYVRGFYENNRGDRSTQSSVIISFVVS